LTEVIIARISSHKTLEVGETFYVIVGWLDGATLRFSQRS